MYTLSDHFFPPSLQPSLSLTPNWFLENTLHNIAQNFPGFPNATQTKSKFHVALFQHVWIWATALLITLSLNSSSFSLLFWHTGFLLFQRSYHTNSCLGDFAFVFLSAWETFLWYFQAFFFPLIFLSSVCLLKYYHIRGTFTNTLIYNNTHLQKNTFLA